MTLSYRQKLTVIPLLLYWPTIFIASHLPKVPRWFIQMQMSDKTLHYIGYLVLVFLLWFAISPNRKVNCRRAAVWWVLLVVAGYGFVDEWLQGYVGRNADVMDFLADMAGALTGLIVLSIFPFRPASLALTGASIFVLTNFMQAYPTGQLPLRDPALWEPINTAFHLFAYALFSLLWTRYMYDLLPIKAPQPKWLIGALSLPIGFLLAAESFSAVAGNGFRLQDIIVSAAGITAVVGTIYLTALFRQRFTQKVSTSDF